MTDELWVKFIRESTASHDRQIGELTDRIAVQTANIDKLVEVTNQRAEAHEHRLDRLDGGDAH